MVVYLKVGGDGWMNEVGGRGEGGGGGRGGWRGRRRRLCVLVCVSGRPRACVGEQHSYRMMKC